MADIVSPEERSRMMSGIRGKNTKPEMLLRKELFRRGYRYRLHDKKLPGKPDLVLPKHNTVIFVHGCFWHQHECHLFKYPSTRPEFWRDKIHGNVERDTRHREEITQTGWRVLVVWECALKGREKRPLDEVAGLVENFLHGNETYFEITGKSE